MSYYYSFVGFKADLLNCALTVYFVLFLSRVVFAFACCLCFVLFLCLGGCLRFGLFCSCFGFALRL